MCWLTWLDRFSTIDYLGGISHYHMLYANFVVSIWSPGITCSLLALSLSWFGGRFWLRWVCFMCLFDWAFESCWLLEQKGKSLDDVAHRLAWTQYVYMIWTKHNRRIFQQLCRSEEFLEHFTIDTVRLKLYTLPLFLYKLRGS